MARRCVRGNEWWAGRHAPPPTHLQATVKGVRGVMVTVIAGPMLNVTATMRDKGKKGIRIRRAKETEGTILSLTALQLVCRPCGKQELLTGETRCYGDTIPHPVLFLLSAHIDGVEWSGLTSLRMSAQWEQSATTSVSLSVLKNFSSTQQRT